MKRVFFYFLTIALVFISCNKEDDLSNNNDQGKHFARESYVNPYNYTGEIHNKVIELAILDEDYVISSTEDKLTFMINGTIQECLNRGITPAELLPNTHDFSKYTESTPESLYAEVIAEMNETEAMYMEMVRELLDNYNETTFSGVQGVESMVNNDEGLNSNEKERLLSSIALAKFSAQFWNDNPQYLSKGGGVWKADWNGFWYGWSMNTLNDTFQEHWQNATGTAELASEMARQDKQ